MSNVNEDATGDIVHSRTKKIRGGHKANLKKVYKDVDDVLQNFEISRKPQLLALRVSLEKKSEVMLKLDEGVLNEIQDEDEISEEIEACDSVQLQIRTKILEIDVFLKRVEDAHTGQKFDVTSSKDLNKRTLMKLPKLEIGKFGGNPKEYRTFKDAFQVAIDDNSSLSRIEKFTYLKSYLTGEAEGAIKGLAATEANYQEALDILDQRFGNKQMIVNCHMDALIKLPQVIGVNSTRSLRKMYDEIEINLRSLRSLGVQPSSFGCLLVPILLSKLPRNLNLHLSRKFDSNQDVWEVDSIMEELKRELEARERCQGESDKNEGSFQKRERTTVESLLAGSQDVSCAYCDGRHYSDQCRTVTDVVKRRELLKSKRRCFQCTRANHMLRDCKSRKCFRCRGNHHASICLKDSPRDEKGKERKDERQEEKKETNDVNETTSTAALSSSDAILLQTAQLVVKPKINTEQGVACKVILDSGSQRSYITKKLSTVIGASIHHKEKMIIGGFGGVKTKEKLHDVVEVVLSKENCKAVPIQGVVVEKICSPLRGMYVESCIKKFPHLHGLPLADEDVEGEMTEVHVLIGLDYYHEIITGETIRGKEGPVAVGSRFGYILSGAMKSTPERPLKTLLTQVLRIQDVTNEELCSEVKRFWEIESIGIKDDHDDNTFDVNVEKGSDRYYVNLPWKTDHPIMGDNYEMSRRRLLSNLAKMRSNSKLMENYCEIMRTQEEAGVIEEVSEDDSVVGKTYYMPHHAVVREDKVTTKTRIVYDASSKSGCASLNECLKSGNTTFTDLFAVLLRFRYYRIAMVADIEQAFLSIGVKEEDRDALRFLWVKDPESVQPKIRHMRFTRVCFGIISSMAHLDVTIRHHIGKFEKHYSDTVQRVRNSLYVDDLTTGHDSSDEAWKLYKESKYIFKEAAMNVRKWMTNDEMLFKKIRMCENPQDRDPQVRCTESQAAESLNPAEKAPLKVLGIPWNTEEDNLYFTLEALRKYYPGRITKRVLLRAVVSVFDPLGFLSPLVVLMKILFQDVCKTTKDWDEVLDTSYQQRWEKIMEDVANFKGLHIERCYCIAHVSSTVLLGFSDASQDAYSACIYIVCRGEDGSVSSSLVASKTRVAPLKTQTIPRLELLASLILSRLIKETMDQLQKVMKISRVICLTDAEIVLNWIQRTDKEYKQFVQNRVDEIRRNTQIESWHHVPGVENAADLPSRGCLPRQLEDYEVKNRWMYGPVWIREESDKWPIRKYMKHIFEDTELKKSVSEVVKKTACYVNSKTEKPSVHEVIDAREFSSLDRLIRVTAWCKRFIDNCRRSNEEKKIDELDAGEWRYAERLWVKSMQHEMKSESGYEKRSQSLGVYEDQEEFLRCRGRIGKAQIQFGTRFPLLIPTNHYVTELIIRDAHKNVYHNGVKETLAEVRSKFWIVKGRQNVKGVVRRCRLCKILEGLAYPAPVSCDLPDFRVCGGRAFEAAGVDFCGPVYIKQMYTKGDAMNKAYISVTTCASSRMIHLELTPDLTTSSYLRSQRRFIARRGYPSMMVSDNGKTFKGRELKTYNAKHGIKWRFNLPKAPWWGGMFERMVRSIKRCLKKVIKNRKLTYEELMTVLVEVEAVVNNRPLTYVEENDADHPLTPSHLFCGRRTLDPPMKSDPEIQEIVGEHAVRRMKLLNTIINHFWRRWSNEYLVELRENHKMRTRERKLNIKEGDVVLVHNDNKKRSEWKLGRIKGLIYGKDEVVRGAILRTCHEGGVSRISRPLQKLYPLEVAGSKENDGKDYATGVIDPNLQVEETDADQGDERVGYTLNENSESLGPPGHALGGGIGLTYEDNIEKLLSKETNLKSKRIAAIDGQLRRRINDIKSV